MYYKAIGVTVCSLMVLFPEVVFSFVACVVNRLPGR